MDFSTLPKVELHLHLDCSLSFAVASRIDPNISFEAYQRDFIAPVKCSDLSEYLTHAEHGIRLMQTAEQLEWVTLDLLQQLSLENTIYAEIRFAPLLHTRNGLKPEEAVDIVCSALSRGMEQAGLEARLLLCTLRHFTEAQSLETIRLAERFKGPVVVGFDIAGDEAGYPVDNHIKAFQYARNRGIPCTAHAGEARGADSVREVLEHFRPCRIGHGVRSVEAPELLMQLREQGIHLEICPTSNVQTGVCEDIDSHPAEILFRSGLSLNINTDGRTLSNITLTEEYQKLHRHFGWGKGHFLQTNLMALEAAFIPQALKEKLKAKLRKAYQY